MVLTTAAHRGLPSGTATGRIAIPYTLSEAAAACGINRSTVLRALKSGKISGTRDEAGAWHVEAAGFFHPLQLPRQRPR